MAGAGGACKRAPRRGYHARHHEPCSLVRCFPGAGPGGSSRERFGDRVDQGRVPPARDVARHRRLLSLRHTAASRRDRCSGSHLDLRIAREPKLVSKLFTLRCEGVSAGTPSIPEPRTHESGDRRTWTGPGRPAPRGSAPPWHVGDRRQRWRGQGPAEQMAQGRLPGQVLARLGLRSARLPRVPGQARSSALR